MNERSGMQSEDKAEGLGLGGAAGHSSPCGVDARDRRLNVGRAGGEARALTVRKESTAQQRAGEWTLRPCATRKRSAGRHLKVAEQPGLPAS